MGCVHSRRSKEKKKKEKEKKKKAAGSEDPILLASQTSFTVSEVEALYELFRKLSCLIFKDDQLLHKEEYRLALLRNRSMQNFFADRIFDLFDIKHNGAIEFGEFVRSLSIFHPNAPQADKISFAFRLYDLKQDGCIEREEELLSWVKMFVKHHLPIDLSAISLKEMVVALLNESDLYLSDDIVEAIVDKTFVQADLKSDGKIDMDEWKEFVRLNPSVMRIMTLPYLKDIGTSFPNFTVTSEGDDLEELT